MANLKETGHIYCVVIGMARGKHVCHSFVGLLLWFIPLKRWEGTLFCCTLISSICLLDMIFGHLFWSHAYAFTYAITCLGTSHIGHSVVCFSNYRFNASEKLWLPSKTWWWDNAFQVGSMYVWSFDGTFLLCLLFLVGSLYTQSRWRLVVLRLASLTGLLNVWHAQRVCDLKVWILAIWLRPSMVLSQPVNLGTACDGCSSCL